MQKIKNAIDEITAIKIKVNVWNCIIIDQRPVLDDYFIFADEINYKFKGSKIYVKENGQVALYYEDKQKIISENIFKNLKFDFKKLVKKTEKLIKNHEEQIIY